MDSNETDPPRSLASKSIMDTEKLFSTYIISILSNQEEPEPPLPEAYPSYNANQ